MKCNPTSLLNNFFLHGQSIHVDQQQVMVSDYHQIAPINPLCTMRAHMLFDPRMGLHAVSLNDPLQEQLNDSINVKNSAVITCKYKLYQFMLITYTRPKTCCKFLGQQFSSQMQKIAIPKTYKTDSLICHVHYLISTLESIQNRFLNLHQFSSAAYYKM